MIFPNDRETLLSICRWLRPGHGDSDGAVIGACVHLLAYSITLLIEPLNGKSVISE